MRVLPSARSATTISFEVVESQESRISAEAWLHTWLRPWRGGVVGATRHIIAGGPESHLTHGEPPGERHDCEWTLALPRPTMDGGEALLWRRDLEPRGAEKRLIELQSPSSPGERNVNSRRKTSDETSQGIYRWMSRSEFHGSNRTPRSAKEAKLFVQSCGSNSLVLGPVRYFDWDS